MHEAGSASGAESAQLTGRGATLLSGREAWREQYTRTAALVKNGSCPDATSGRRGRPGLRPGNRRAPRLRVCPLLYDNHVCLPRRATF
jgi:hypothetical protein